MSFFAFNFRPKRMNESNEKENQLKPSMSRLNVRLESSVGRKQTMFGLDSTPNTSTPLANKTNESEINRKCFEPKNPLSVDSSVEQISKDSNELRQRVTEELEKIETWKALTEMEVNRRIEENKELKSTVEELTNKLMATENENSRLKARLTSDVVEREEVVLKMNTTREMFVRVKDYVQTIEERIESYREVKDVMELVNDHRCQQLEQMDSQFSQLSLKHKTIVSDIESKLVNKNSEIIDLREKFEKISFDFDLSRSDANNRFLALESELNQNKQLSQTLESDLNEAIAVNKDMNQKINEFNEKYESLVKTSQQKTEEFEDLRQKFETELEEMENKIQLFVEKEKDFKQQINDFIVEIESKNEEIIELKNNIENKNKEIESQDSKLETKEQELNELLAKNNDSIESYNELKSNLISIEIEKQNLEMSAENEKQLLISEYEHKIKDFESSLESVREQTNQLSKINEQNESLMNELESKANQTINEKEMIEQQLQNDIKQLKDEFDNKMNEFSIKINELEDKIEKLNVLKVQNETTIEEILTETEVLKTEKQSLESKLEREERSLELQISNMNNIIESVKSDYNKRIEDKEDRIKEYKRENERMRLNVEHLNKKCERLEFEKQSTNRKLQELTISAMRSSNSSPNRVSTPKFMSPIESGRFSGQRTSSPIAPPIAHPLADSPKQFEDDLVLSAKHELEEKIINKNIQKVEKLNKNKPKIETKIESKPKPIAVKGKDSKKVLKLDDSDTNESIYEIKENKFKKVRKGLPNNKDHKRTDGSKHRTESPVRVDMSLAKVEDSLTDKLKGKDKFDEYDIEKVDEPMKKKLKTGVFGIKTYSKSSKVRVENILKNRPTPHKDNDLSWLNF